MFKNLKFFKSGLDPTFKVDLKENNNTHQTPNDSHNNSILLSSNLRDHNKQEGKKTFDKNTLSPKKKYQNKLVKSHQLSKQQQFINEINNDLIKKQSEQILNLKKREELIKKYDSKSPSKNQKKSHHIINNSPLNKLMGLKNNTVQWNIHYNNNIDSKGSLVYQQSPKDRPEKKQIVTQFSEFELSRVENESNNHQESQVQNVSLVFPDINPMNNSIGYKGKKGEQQQQQQQKSSHMVKSGVFSSQQLSQCGNSENESHRNKGNKSLSQYASQDLNLKYNNNSYHNLNSSSILNGNVLKRGKKLTELSINGNIRYESGFSQKQSPSNLNNLRFYLNNNNNDDKFRIQSSDPQNPFLSPVSQKKKEYLHQKKKQVKSQDSKYYLNEQIKNQFSQQISLQKLQQQQNQIYKGLHNLQKNKKQNSLHNVNLNDSLNIGTETGAKDGKSKSKNYLSLMIKNDYKERQGVIDHFFEEKQKISEYEKEQNSILFMQQQQSLQQSQQQSQQDQSQQQSEQNEKINTANSPIEARSQSLIENIVSSPKTCDSQKLPQISHEYKGTNGKNFFCRQQSMFSSKKIIQGEYDFKNFYNVMEKSQKSPLKKKLGIKQNFQGKSKLIDRVKGEAAMSSSMGPQQSYKMSDEIIQEGEDSYNNNSELNNNINGKKFRRMNTQNIYMQYQQDQEVIQKLCSKENLKNNSSNENSVVRELDSSQENRSMETSIVKQHSVKKIGVQ